MRKYTLSFIEANVYSLLTYIPIVVGYALPYGLLYGWSAMWVDLVQFLDKPVLFLSAVVLGTIAHEAIHAICWSWLDDIPWKKIHFGFKWKVLTPYVHCPESVEVSNYRWGVAMPGIVLGVIPYLLSLILQNGWLLGFGLFFTLAASGDLLILWLLRNVRAGQRVQDHPEEVGCEVVDENVNVSAQ